MDKEYLIFRVKIDKNYKCGYMPESFAYIDEAADYASAKEKAEAHKKSGYSIGIETITRY